jgi:hypothetical protein
MFVLPPVHSKPVHWVEASDVLCSLVLPMLLTVMVAVTTASAGRVTQHRQDSNVPNGQWHYMQTALITALHAGHVLHWLF